MPAPTTLPAGTAIRSMNKRHLVMPGLINAHNHISNHVVRGTFDEGSREDYGTRMFAALRALDGDASYAGALSSLVEQLCGGINHHPGRRVRARGPTCGGAQGNPRCRAARCLLAGRHG